MSIPYGKFSRASRKSTLPEAKRVSVRMSGSADLETLSYGIQRLIAHLTEQKIDGVSEITIEFMPRKSGQDTILRNRDGQQVDKLRMPIPETMRFHKIST